MKKLSYIALISLFMGINLWPMEQNEVNNKRKRQNEKAQEIEGKIKKNKIEKTEDEVEREEEIGWNSLPIEIKAYILSFLLKTNDLIEALDKRKLSADIFKQFATLRSTSPDIRSIVLDKRFFNIKSIARHIITKNITKNYDHMYMFHIMIVSARWLRDLCKKLIAGGVAPKSNNPLLLNAIYLQKINTIEDLIRHKQGTVLLNDAINDELTLAAGIGNVRILNLLLQRNGSDINKQDQFGETILMFAVAISSTGVVKFLIDAKINIHTKNILGRNALMIAIMSGDSYLVEFLLNKGANVSESDNEGSTPLMFSAMNGCEKVMKLLLARGAAVNICNDKGLIALMYAAINGHKKAIELLLDEGADINVRDIHNITSLMYAVINGNKELAELLVDRGAEISQRSIFGKTAFLYAAEYGHKQIIEFFLNMGISVNEQSDQGNTALMLSAANGHEEILMFLLDRGADLNIENLEGKTAINIAESQLALLNSSESNEVKNKLERVDCYESIIQRLKHHTENRSSFIDFSFNNMD